MVFPPRSDVRAMPGSCLFFFRNPLKENGQPAVPLMQALFIIIATMGQGECIQHKQIIKNVAKGAVKRNNA
jgi:hypothetical protein